MKLHLPKALLTMVLAACIAPAVWAGNWGNNGPNSSVAGNCYYSGAEEDVVNATINAQANIKELYIAQAVDGDKATGSKPALIKSLLLKNGDKLTIEAHPWKEAGTVNFSLLTVDSLTVGDGTGNATLVVGANQSLALNELNGSIDKMTVDGTMTMGFDYTFSSASQVTGAGTLVIGDGAKVTMSHGGDTSAIQSAIKILGGAKLIANQGDTLGWCSGATKSITLVGTSDTKKAIFELGDRQTMSTAITMQGNALITGAGSLESYGTLGSNTNNATSATNVITVTGLNNKIESTVFVRSHLNIAVTNDADTLEISGDIGCRSNSDAKGRFTKSGAGTLTLSGTNNFVNTEAGYHSFLTTGGKTIITGNTTVAGSLGMQKGGSIDFTGGVHNIAKLDIHNNNEVNSTETLTIAGATVKITGEDGDVTGTTTGAAAVTIGHWNNGGGKIVVGGKTASASLFDVSGATIRMSWDSNSVLEINKNGTVNAKRIQFANDNGDNAVITLAGGRLNLGEGGISANSHEDKYTGDSKREINLNSGTLGALAESVNIAAGTTNIGGAITIDTAIVDAEGEKTGKTANISFSNNVVLSDAAAFTIKGGGNVSINALAVKNTLKFDVQEATVLNVENVSLSLQDGAIALDTANVYTDNSEGTISAANGFAKSAYQLFDGYEWSGSETIDTYSVVTQGGDTFLLSDNSEVGTIYYVNKGTHTISTAGDYINGRALGYSVAENAGLVIDGASGDLSAADLLTGTTGEGNITVKTDISLSDGAKSKAEGKLTVEGVSLSMGKDKGHNINLSSFSSVDLNGATLNYHGANTTFNNVTVGATGATISIHDMKGEYGACDAMTLAGTTTLNGALNIKSSQWKYTVSIESLSGSGNLDISSSAAQDDFAVVNVGLAGYTGAITVTKNTGAATLNATSAGVVNLTGITLKNGATGTFAVSANANLGDVNIGAGSLSISNTGATTATTTLNTLQGSGSLSFTGNDTARTLVISSLQGYTGSLTVTKGTGAATLNATTGGAVTLSGITLAGGATGTLAVSGAANLGGVNIGAGSLSISNTGATTATTTLNTLQGSGSLSFTGNDTARTLVISSLQGYTGSLTVTKGTGAATLNATTGGAVTLSGLTLSGGATGNFLTTADVTLGAVELTGESKLSLQRKDDAYSVNISALTISDIATIETVNGANGNNSWQADFSIGKLVGTDATLKLRSGSNTTAATVFNLNGGEGSNFSGAIEVGVHNTADGRKAVLNINDSTIASNAEIRFNAGNDKKTAYLALGEDNVAVKGISDVAGAAQIVSGNVDVGATAVNSGDKVRTLTINTQGNSYSTAAKIDKNINLVKSGKGTQTFSGDVSAFNGSVTVKEGELALSAVGTGENALNLTTLDLQGGTLSLGTEGNVGEIVISKPTTGSVVANMSANTVLNGHLSLNEGVALSLSGWGDNAADINGKLTLGNGAHLQATAELMEEIKSLELDSSPLLLLEYDSFQLGNTEFAELSVAADAMIESTPLLGSIVDANTYFSSLNVGDYELLFAQNGLYIQVSNPIPEPTTATLSLLALAALASRRRRK